MVLKNFQIDYEGRKETIEYEADLAFGDMEAILKNTVDLSDINKPKINMSEYRIQILIKCLKKAPFMTGDVTALRAVKRSVIKQIMPEVMKDYPLIDSLADWMTSFMGSLTMNDSSTESTPTVQPPSDGTNPQ